MATTDRQKYWNPSQMMGAENDEESIPIDAITDGSGTRRLAVDATVTSGFVVETDSDLADDEILVGNTTDGGTTRTLAKGDVNGRFQVDVERIGSVAPSLDGGRLQTNATLQIADADSPGGAGAVNASTPRTVTASDSPDVTSLQIIDDWDESDRAKVNLIVGQAGVQGASGVVSASTQRVTLATDVALPAGANAIGKLAANDGVDVGDVTVNNAAGASAVNVQDGGNSLTVDNSTLAVVGGGVEATALRVTVANDSTGVVSVDDNGGTLTVDQATAANLNAQIIGTLAHDDADTAANKPVKVGARALVHGADPVAVAAGDVSHLHTNRDGILWTIGGHPNIQTSQFVVTDAGGAVTNDNLLPLIAAGTKYAVTRISVVCDVDGSTAVGFRVGFGAATIPAEPASAADAVAGILLTHPGLVPGGGITVGDGSGVLGVGGDGEDLRVTCEDPVGGSAHFTVSWFSIES